MTNDEWAAIKKLGNKADADLTPADRNWLFRYEQWQAANEREVFAGMTGEAAVASGDLAVRRMLTPEMARCLRSG